MALMDLVVSDCPWGFSDQLTMSDVKRGAKSNYSTMTVEQIKSIPVADITADNCILALWAVSSQLGDALDVMQAWGFKQKQTFIWVKTKNDPFDTILSEARDQIKRFMLENNYSDIGIKEIVELLKLSKPIFSVDSILSFGLGRLLRNVHEICLIGTKGSVYKQLQNRSQRTVSFAPVTKHSQKPEILQDRLDLMFPDTAEMKLNRLEMFARRQRPGWICVGNEMPLSEDIFDSIERIKKL